MAGLANEVAAVSRMRPIWRAFWQYPMYLTPWRAAAVAAMPEPGVKSTMRVSDTSLAKQCVSSLKIDSEYSHGKQLTLTLALPLPER